MNEDLQRGARQLLAAQQELVLKEKLAVLGQVAGSVGHELRNPLGVMNNAVFYLQNTMVSDPDGKTRKHLNIIKNEIAASERIVADLLELGAHHAAAPKRSGGCAVDRADPGQMHDPGVGRRQVRYPCANYAAAI